MFVKTWLMDRIGANLEPFCGRYWIFWLTTRRHSRYDVPNVPVVPVTFGNRRYSTSIGDDGDDAETPGYAITPHVGFGVGAADVFDGLKLPGIGQVLNGSSWQFGYQGIAGIRYHLSGALTLDLDYRFFATIEPRFSIPRTNLQYSTYYKTNNFVASVTYRFAPPPPAPASVSLEPKSS